MSSKTQHNKSNEVHYTKLKYLVLSDIEVTNSITTYLNRKQKIISNLHILFFKIKSKNFI